MRLAALAHRVVLAWGWQRAAVASAAGGTASLAMPPTGSLLWPAIFLAFPVLVWLIDGAGAGGGRGLRAAAVTGWWFGFGYFVAGLWWTANALLVEADKFAWFLPLAICGLPAGLALFTAAGAAFARALWLPGPARVLALAVGLGAAEWLRGHALTGFPWNTFGYALAADARIAQSVSLGGVWSLTLLTVALGALPALLADERRTTARPLAWLGAGAAVLAGLFAFGAARLATTDTAFVEGVRLRIMQPNLPQDQKFRYSAKDAVMARYVALSEKRSGPERLGIGDATHLIWPESAFPFFLEREADALAKIADLLPRGTTLITGAARAVPRPDRGPREIDVYNAIQVVDSEGGLVATYDKVWLVPFGEFLPFQALLESLGLEQLTRVRGGFTAGTARRTLAIPGLPLAVPLICYEIIFPGDAVPDGRRPALLLNVTNDGWFGRSAGPHQHFAQARIRAIEEGLPLVRAANTGISAVADPLGRIVGMLAIGEEDVLDAQLPVQLPATTYATFRDLVPAAIWAAILFMVFLAHLRKNAQRRVPE